MGFARLVLLSFLMLVSTLLASFSPLYLKLSPKTVQAVSIYSTGLLVGAALTVVIPEGVATVFMNAQSGDEHHDDDGEEHRQGEFETSSHWVGVALLGGFILMYLIDSVHGHDEYRDPDRPRHSPRHRPHYISVPSHLAELEPLSLDGSREPSAERPGSGRGAEERQLRWEENGGMLPGPTRGSTSSQSGTTSTSTSGSEHWLTADASSISTVIGLLAHSLADGVSLGASSLSTSPTLTASLSSASEDDSSNPLQLIVFLAIMLHKAPTAFALSSLLTSSPSNSPGFTRRALLLFSLVAPVGAILTYGLLSLLGAGPASGTGWYTGLALVFSGGTFLFVATHAVREQEKRARRQAEEGDPAQVGDRAKLALVLGGMCTPGLLARVVGHGH
ncbi:hypothetical protein JCM21900_004739 [Sporobolomyces salmonicolor]